MKTSSGATAVQIVYSRRKGSRQIEHVGSAHTDVELELLTSAATQKLAAGQSELDLGSRRHPRPVVRCASCSRMGHVWDSLAAGYAALGFDEAAGDVRAAELHLCGG